MFLFYAMFRNSIGKAELQRTFYIKCMIKHKEKLKIIFLARKPNILSSTFPIMLLVLIFSVLLLYNVINSQDDVENLQHDLSCVSHWALVNELTFQPAKCENLPISRKRNSFNRLYSLNSVLRSKYRLFFSRSRNTCC